MNWCVTEVADGGARSRVNVYKYLYLVVESIQAMNVI